MKRRTTAKTLTCAETRTARKGAPQITISFSVQKESPEGERETKVEKTAGKHAPLQRNKKTS